MAEGRKPRRGKSQFEPKANFLLTNPFINLINPVNSVNSSQPRR
jgi:hypothetical protein